MTNSLETRAERTKNRQKFEANEMKALRKIVGKTKTDRIISQQITENPVLSNLLMSEWKEEEENGTNM